MDELTKKSLVTLELPRVLEMLASFAVSDGAKERARALEPSDWLEDVRREQAKTTAARDLMGNSGSPAFTGVKDVSASLMRVDHGGVLNARELLQIAWLCRAARLVRDYVGDESERSTVLDVYFRSLKPNKFLEERILNAIISEDEIADSASPALSDIRRKKSQASNRVRETLQRIITSPAYSKYLRETLITTRSGRFVVPVKAENRGEISGLVHDVSSSGATIFIEPMQVVEANNEIKELEGKEKDEIDRILAEMSNDVAGFSGDIGENYSLLVELDLCFAKGKLSYHLECCEPEINDRGRLDLIQAKHPLLPKGKAVPISVRLGIDFDALIITGPNTGGKTVTLKTVGLLSVMAACGLHIPAKPGSTLPVYSKIYADIGDEQSIEQSLSTFSSHMTTIVKILDGMDDRTLILFDELGAGTDPVEGAALAVSVIEYAREMKAKIVATTHYAELKTYALTTARVENAGCEFDVDSLRPTYRLLIGIPGKSNAFEISRRLGLPDYVIDKAKSLVDSEDQRFEDVLRQLDEKRIALENERSEAEKLRRDAEILNARARDDYEKISKEREKATETAKAEATRLLTVARNEVDAVMKELGRLRKSGPQMDPQALNEARAQIGRRINEASNTATPKAKKPALIPNAPKRPIRQGDIVIVNEYGSEATVLTDPDKNGNMTLQAGILKMTLNVSQVTLTAEKPKEKQSGNVSFTKSATPAKMEVDIRGMTGDEGVEVVTNFIDHAFMSKLETVTVIHGKGTGALRAAIQRSLRSNPHVRGFRLGTYGEGETGVTIVELKK